MTRRESMFFELNTSKEEELLEAKRQEALRVIVRDPKEYKRMFECEFIEDHHDGH